MNKTTVLNASLNYLSEKPNSEKALRSYLETEFGHSKEVTFINEILEQLKDDHLLDDSRLANSVASHYTHKGNRFIVDLLQEKGIEEPIISEALSQLDSEVDRALKEVNKRFNGYWDNSQKMISCVYRFLHGRQFSHLTARIVANELSFKIEFLQKSCLNLTNEDCIYKS